MINFATDNFSHNQHKKQQDIEDDAFNGCSTLRFIDATAVTSLVPSSLNREATATPFYGLPKQTLVYLTGPTVGGENYIYKIAASTYR